MDNTTQPPKPVIPCPACEHLMSVSEPRLIILNSSDISVLTMIHEPVACPNCQTEFQTSINEQATQVIIALAAKPTGRLIQIPRRG